MAETFKYVDSRGKSFEAPDTAANRKAVVDQGYSVDDSILRSIGEVARGVEESIPGVAKLNPATWLPQLALKGVASAAGAKPSDELGPAPTLAGKLIYVDSRGQTHDAPDTEANREAILGQGYALADDKQKLQHLALSDPRFQGARGEVQTFAANSQNEYLFGLPAMAADAKALPQGTFSPALQDKATRQALDAANPESAALGSTAGVIASMLTPGLKMGGATARAEGLGARAAVTLGAKEGGLIASVAGGAARGATLAAPNAAGKLVFEGDAAGAGETLLAGAGVGALFGGGSVAARRAVNGSKAAAALASEAAGKTAGAAGLTAEELASKGVGKAAELAGSAVGGLTHGFAGYAAGKAAGKAAGVVAEKIFSDPRVQAVALKAARAAGRALDGIPSALARMGDGAVKLSEVESFGSMGRLTGDASASRQAQFEAVRDRLAELQGDPERRARDVGRFASAFDVLEQAAVTSMNAQANAALDHLARHVPKDPSPPKLFGPPSPWKPSDAQLSSFERRVQVVNDPFSVVRELQSCTLTKEHVETLDAVFPAIAKEMRKRVTAAAAAPSPPKLSALGRAQVELLLGGKAGDASGYQVVYSTQAAKGQPKGSASVRLPGSEPTGAQKLAMR